MLFRSQTRDLGSSRVRTWDGRGTTLWSTISRILMEASTGNQEIGSILRCGKEQEATTLSPKTAADDRWWNNQWIVSDSTTTEKYAMDWKCWDPRDIIQFSGYWGGISIQHYPDLGLVEVIHFMTGPSQSPREGWPLMSRGRILMEDVLLQLWSWTVDGSWRLQCGMSERSTVPEEWKFWKANWEDIALMLWD